MKMSPDSDESIRCSASGCSCTCFRPGSVQLRSCDRCGHTWVAHALEKLQFQAQQPSSCGPVEVALPGLVFDLSSLVLYGAQALPVRLKILLDRLYSILTPEQVGHILHTLGWSLGDYVRGYMLQYRSGKVLDRWLMVTPEEELLILKQFLRFGETRPIVELMSLQLSDPELNPAHKGSQSNISTFIERGRGTPGVLRNTRAAVERFEKNDTVHHVENVPQSLLLPFHFPGSSFHCLVPPSKELLPPGKPTQCLRKPSGTKLAERQRQDGGRREPESDLILPPALKIKVDPDRPNPVRSIWHQFNNDQELDLHRGVAKQEHASSLSPPLTSSFIPTSYSLRPTVSTSPPKISQKLQSSSSYSLSPLPSFSSSFLCPLPSSSFSSSLHPLPSSLCSLTSLSPAGGRKGRVCCGVCGKSFYDKGTLKIHYNAVHLKIKHRCTVTGCTMVFSSLRSRNRHSANPNPRLHTGAGRDAHRSTHPDQHTNIRCETQTDKNTPKSTHNAHMCREKESRNTLWQEEDAHTLVHRHPLRNRLNGHGNHQHGRQDDTMPQADSPPPSSHPQTWTLSRDADQNFPLSSCRPVLRPPPLLPPRSSSSLGSPPSLVPLVFPTEDKTEGSRHLFSLHATHTAPEYLPGPASITTATRNSQSMPCDNGVTEGKRGGAQGSPLTNQQRRCESGDPVPKKKPRKSSMPVKIDREKMERGRNEEEEGC